MNAALQTHTPNSVDIKVNDQLSGRKLRFSELRKQLEEAIDAELFKPNAINRRLIRAICDEFKVLLKDAQGRA